MKALVTGASSGIGRDMARYLSNLGYDLIIVAQREERLIELKKELKTNVQVISMDLSIKENCINLYESVKEQEIDLIESKYHALYIIAGIILSEYDKYKHYCCTHIDEIIFKGYEKEGQRKNLKCSVSSWICTRTTNGSILFFKSICT